MDLTNFEGIECLECITVFSEVASKLSGRSTLRDVKVKKIGNVTVTNYYKRSLLPPLCFIIYGQGSSEKVAQSSGKKQFEVRLLLVSQELFERKLVVQFLLHY